MSVTETGQAPRHFKEKPKVNRGEKEEGKGRKGVEKRERRATRKRVRPKFRVVTASVTTTNRTTDEGEWGIGDRREKGA